jgi:hypothetical protein
MVREHMDELAKVVSRARPAHGKAREAPQGAAVLDREVVSVFLPDDKGVVPIGEVERDEVVAWTGKVAKVLEGLARHVER